MKKLLCMLLLLLFVSGVFAQKVDYDLTKMTGLMAYSFVFEVLVDPESYRGDIIKANGFFYRGLSEFTGRNFNYVMVGDDTACCWQGLEFLISGVENTDENYPAQNADIEVVGELKSYDAAGYTFFYLDVKEVIEL